MTKTTGIILAALGGFFILVLSIGLGYISFTNDANRLENGITAQYRENQNVYDSGWKKVTEVAQVPKAQVEQMKGVYMAAIQGTFGANGSQALFQAFQVHQINIDQSTYRKVQQVIEAFRDEFKQRQSEMASRRQTYDNLLNATTSGRFYNMIAAYPHIDLDKYTTMVTSKETKTTFDTKESDPLKVF